MGECGFRGGYAEIIGMDEETRMVLSKILSSMLCPNIAGQLILSTYVNPPKEGEASYDSFTKEKDLISSALRRKSQLVHELLNSLNGITMNRLTGSMYAFPKIFLPKGFIEYVKNNEKIVIRNPDEYYCLLLLENTGIVSIPGSGFGQKKGTWHFRITILPIEEKLKKCLDMFKEFHLKLIKDFT
ncbi:hypothetical protein LOD99_10939 [Oopsacas minuta]|uniref:Alanine aminotransferase n=1 Tax=Oopsacas minuta TaxID=111878 RepID=A0AAV7KCC1_9METZ|nr:hypothetical protein LOD99_10939 [Oopsacas minuta]